MKFAVMKFALGENSLYVHNANLVAAVTTQS